VSGRRLFGCHLSTLFPIIGREWHTRDVLRFLYLNSAG
jgi:hypothetical protein